MVLSKMNETAEVYLRQEVKHVVITVPAYLDNSATGDKSGTNKGRGAGQQVTVLRQSVSSMSPQPLPSPNITKHAEAN